MGGSKFHLSEETQKNFRFRRCATERFRTTLLGEERFFLVKIPK